MKTLYFFLGPKCPNFGVGVTGFGGSEIKIKGDLTEAECIARCKVGLIFLVLLDHTCLAFSLRFWPKIKQLLCNCQASN